MNKARMLRDLFESRPIVRIVGAHNALGAKLIERHGFDGVWASGFEIATAHGVPDASILTMTENLQAAESMSMATRLPVICDCDTGYGNAVHVMHMVRKYEASNMAAVVVEDKLFPKMNSFIPGRQELASVEEFCGKIQAARSASSSREGIMIFARVEALIAGWGMQEACRRAAAYCEAGADGIVMHSKQPDPREVFAFARWWKENGFSRHPLVAIPTTYASVTSDELAAAGFRMVIFANQGIRASVRGMDQALRRMRETGSTRDIEKDIASMDEIFQLQGMPGYQEDEKRYLPEGEKICAVIPAAADHRFQPELSQVLKDLPLCSLELGSKTVLQHQMDVLRGAGIRDFKVVVGYKKDRIRAPGAELVENPEYSEKGSAHSTLLGLEKTRGKTMIVYSDILFDRQIAEAAVKSPHAVTLVIDRAFRSLPRRDKQLDLVLTAEDTAPASTRKLGVEHYKTVVRVGKKIDPALAYHEFIGMALVSAEGLEWMKTAWKKARENFADSPFGEAPYAGLASLTDVFQCMIDSGLPVHGLVVEHGWSEIYSLDDYERLSRYFSEPAVRA